MPLDVVVPVLGESITEATVLGWKKALGEAVAKDEILVEIETDKVSLEVSAETAGVLTEILAKEGQDVEVGAVLARIDTEMSAPAATVSGPAPAPMPEPPSAPDPVSAVEASVVAPPVSRLDLESATAPSPLEPVVAPPPVASVAETLPSPVAVRRSGAGGKITDADLREFLISGEPLSPTERRAVLEGGFEFAKPVVDMGVSEAPAPALESPPQPSTSREDAAPPPASVASGARVRREPMSRLRRRIAERLKEAQNTAAMLTTFNEADMTHVMALRKAHGPGFEKLHGVRLGFMPFFIKACVSALRAFPMVNAEIDGDDIVYKDHYDIGVAVGGGRGLVVPVIRNADRAGFAGIERTISDFAARANDGTLRADELEGGTFTISNGGVYGSMLSTPILNPPQSGILGLHRIQERPVADSGTVVIRPMMYLALSYDHRLVDGREAVSFLIRVRDALEQPGQLALDV